MPYMDYHNIQAERARLKRLYQGERSAHLLKTLRRAALLVTLTALLYTCGDRSAHAWDGDRDREVDAIIAIEASGGDIPRGGAGVYSDDFGKRIGSVERLGDGSTVLRGDFGKVLAKVEPRNSADEPLRVTVKGKR